MENFKGTKGSWIIDEDKWIITDNKNEDGDIVCAPPEDWDLSMENWDANAKLISKAPEMLEFLNQLSYACENGLIQDLEELGKRAKELIKSATEL